MILEPDILVTEKPESKIPDSLNVEATMTLPELLTFMLTSDKDLVVKFSRIRVEGAEYLTVDTCDRHDAHNHFRVELVVQPDKKLFPQLREFTKALPDALERVS